jgi:hypothetical protein
LWALIIHYSYAHFEVCVANNYIDPIQDIHSLISDYQHSISAGKLKLFPMPPPGRLVTSTDKQRWVIAEKNSLATVQEFEMRERRITSLLDRSGFLLTDRPETLGFTSESLDKFRAGLNRAMHMADRLCDVAADPEVAHTRASFLIQLTPLRLHHNSSPSDEAAAALRNAEREGLIRYTQALRAKQIKILRDLSTIDLAFLLHLSEGAMLGWRRYMAKYVNSDVRFWNKVKAFGELVIREGSFMLWAFVRGTGNIRAFANMAVRVVAEQVWQYTAGVEMTDGGLAVALHDELKQRLHAVMWAADPCFNASELEGPMTVQLWAYGLVAVEIGCKDWNGYNSRVASLALAQSLN